MLNRANNLSKQLLIRVAGLKALARELGPVGMVHFLQQFETGKGDYSKERHKWLNALDVNTIAENIQEQREELGK